MKRLTLNNLSCSYKKLGQNELASEALDQAFRLPQTNLKSNDPYDSSNHIASYESLQQLKRINSDSGGSLEPHIIQSPKYKLGDNTALYELNKCALHSAENDHYTAKEYAEQAVIKLETALSQLFQRKEKQGLNIQLEQLFLEKQSLLAIAYYNLGCEYEHLDLIYESVEAYQRAVKIESEKSSQTSSLVQKFKDTLKSAKLKLNSLELQTFERMSSKSKYSNSSYNLKSSQKMARQSLNTKQFQRQSTGKSLFSKNLNSVRQQIRQSSNQHQRPQSAVTRMNKVQKKEELTVYNDNDPADCELDQDERSDMVNPLIRERQQPPVIESKELDNDMPIQCDIRIRPSSAQVPVNKNRQQHQYNHVCSQNYEQMSGVISNSSSSWQVAQPKGLNSRPPIQNSHKRKGSTNKSRGQKQASQKRSFIKNNLILPNQAESFEQNPIKMATQYINQSNQIQKQVSTQNHLTRSDSKILYEQEQIKQKAIAQAIKDDQPFRQTSPAKSNGQRSISPEPKSRYQARPGDTIKNGQLARGQRPQSSKIRTNLQQAQFLSNVIDQSSSQLQNNQKNKNDLFTKLHKGHQSNSDRASQQTIFGKSFFKRLKTASKQSSTPFNRQQSTPASVQISHQKVEPEVCQCSRNCHKVITKEQKILLKLSDPRAASPKKEVPQLIMNDYSRQSRITREYEMIRSCRVGLGKNYINNQQSNSRVFENNFSQSQVQTPSDSNGNAQEPKKKKYIKLNCKSKKQKAKKQTQNFIQRQTAQGAKQRDGPIPYYVSAEQHNTVVNNQTLTPKVIETNKKHQFDSQDNYSTKDNQRMSNQDLQIKTLDEIEQQEQINNQEEQVVVVTPTVQANDPQSKENPINDYNTEVTEIVKPQADDHEVPKDFSEEDEYKITLIQARFRGNQARNQMKSKPAAKKEDLVQETVNNYDDSDVQKIVKIQARFRGNQCRKDSILSRVTTKIIETELEDEDYDQDDEANQNIELDIKEKQDSYLDEHLKSLETKSPSDPDKEKEKQPMLGGIVIKQFSTNNDQEGSQLLRLYKGKNLVRIYETIVAVRTKLYKVKVTHAENDAYNLKLVLFRYQTQPVQIHQVIDYTVDQESMDQMVKDKDLYLNQLLSRLQYPDDVDEKQLELRAEDIVNKNNSSEADHSSIIKSLDDTTAKAYKNYRSIEDSTRKQSPSPSQRAIIQLAQKQMKDQQPYQDSQLVQESVPKDASRSRKESNDSQTQNYSLDQFIEEEEEEVKSEDLVNNTLNQHEKSIPKEEKELQINENLQSQEQISEQSLEQHLQEQIIKPSAKVQTDDIQLNLVKAKSNNNTKYLDIIQDWRKNVQIRFKLSNDTDQFFHVFLYQDEKNVDKKMIKISTKQVIKQCDDPEEFKMLAKAFCREWLMPCINIKQDFNSVIKQQKLSLNIHVDMLRSVLRSNQVKQNTEMKNTKPPQTQKLQNVNRRPSDNKESKKDLSELKPQLQTKKLGELAMMKKSMSLPNCFDGDECIVTAKCLFDRNRLVVQAVRQNIGYELNLQDAKLNMKSMSEIQEQLESVLENLDSSNMTNLGLDQIIEEPEIIYRKGIELYNQTTNEERLYVISVSVSEEDKKQIVFDAIDKEYLERMVLKIKWPFADQEISELAIDSIMGQLDVQQVSKMAQQQDKKNSHLLVPSNILVYKPNEFKRVKTDQLSFDMNKDLDLQDKQQK